MPAASTTSASAEPTPEPTSSCSPKTSTSASSTPSPANSSANYNSTQPSTTSHKTTPENSDLAGSAVADVLRDHMVPPAGFEPAPPPPEGGALSPELRGLGHAEASSARAMIIGVEVVPVASPLWLVPGVSSSSMTTM